jgi:hypothetical protein
LSHGRSYCDDARVVIFRVRGISALLCDNCHIYCDDARVSTYS